eukprot:GHUV01009534.1.p1 GENE.GHUV01009534.1~~GHUV01009534.1.p1  ORF type:complete len:411 (+),score=112.65 GHUV01009534.1:134-1366(+)
MSKVYWVGRHATRPELGSPVSKVHGAGLAILKQLGWQQVADDTQDVPVFAFTTRKGANYPADQPNLPTIRQLAHSSTACLDDKCLMQQHLRTAGKAHLLPPCWDTLDDFTAWVATHLPTAQSKEPNVLSLRAADRPTIPSRPSQGGASPPADISSAVRTLNMTAASDIGTTTSSGNVTKHGVSSSASASLPGGLYFIKHRSGVKGQAVYPVQTVAQLQQLQQRLKASSRNFIVQQEVPPLLLDGRKFVLRLQVLVSVLPLQVHLHEDVILIKHACDYSSTSRDLAAHISSKGANHPKPLLLGDMPALREQIWPQLQQLVLHSIRAVQEQLTPRHVDPKSVLYHLFGYDCMVDATGRVVLLEVNSYPAIASGTMSAVDVRVCTSLLHHMLKLLVLPVTGDAEPDPGGFVLL